MRNPFVLLKPIHSQPRLSTLKVMTSHSEALAEFRAFTAEYVAASPIAIDFETKGNLPHLAETLIMGFALSDERGSRYFPWSPEVKDELCAWIRLSKPFLLAHNWFFDGALLYRELGETHAAAGCCTFGLYKQTATEGWAGQRWGLKAAQVDLLRWEEKGDVELDRWLVDNGFTRGKGKTLKADKAEMWRAPTDILGYYCCLDADATWQLFSYVLAPVVARFGALWVYHHDVFLPNVALLIEQYFSGALIDRESLIVYDSKLQSAIPTAREEFLGHAEISRHIEAWTVQRFQKLIGPEPQRYKATKPEPKKHRKDGQVTASWTRWNEQGGSIPQESANWTRWEKKRETLNSKPLFNIDSGLHKRWLFYDALGFPVVSLTKSGAPAVGKLAANLWGEPGKLLNDYAKLVKEQQYTSACLVHSERDSLIHPQFRTPGTLTGRLSGSGGFNVQQLSKSEEYLRCWIARPGHLLIDCDFTALEMYVLAELSKDPTLWKLYAPGQPQQDVYLFNGCFLEGLSDAIRGAGYDPENPTPESIEKAKKLAKRERNIAKAITLACGYGAGAKKIRMTLQTQGIAIGMSEAEAMWYSYWSLYSQVRDYGDWLTKQLKRNRGWVLNGIGRPMGISREKEKDVINSVVQSTGHDIVQVWILLFVDLFKAHGIRWNPILIDTHDASLIEVYEDDAEKAADLMGRVAFDQLNELMGGVIPFKGDTNIVRNYAESKI